MQKSERRFDIDWLRVIAIFLLLVYHVAIPFQPWGAMIGFITSNETWETLWLPMTMLNVWRIPLLFFVSGMGVYFAIQSRTLKALFIERSRRIFLPYLFGIFAIVPIHMAILFASYGMQPSYNYSPAHLWFLGNIFAYVLILSPVFYYLNTNKDKAIGKRLKNLFSKPYSLLIVYALFLLEAILVKPVQYELYAITWHGFYLGFLAFFFGFVFALTAKGFWAMLVKWRFAFLFLAITLFAVRLLIFNSASPSYLLVAESNLWIFTVFAFAQMHLNKNSKALRYLTSAVYPVYILHMVFLYLASLYVFKLTIAVELQFILVLLLTVIGSFASYELIKRIKFLRPLFGLK